MQSENLLGVLTLVFVLGVGAQWLAWRFGMPSILFLLLAGFIAGPATGYIVPDRQFGALLLPFVSLSVGVILFEGGLSLNFRELRGMWRSLIGLLTVGIAMTWALSTLLARVFLGLPFPTALLLGALLTVTGPTVIGPLLRHIRPSGEVGSIAKWEGIIIDPIGATLAVLVFEASDAIGDAAIGSVTYQLFYGLGATLLAGVSVGLGFAVGLIVMLRRFWLPDHLQSSVALMFVLAAFTVANKLHGEAGLLAVTVMGIALANQRFVSVDAIAEFKENLSLLLIAMLFILLSARISPQSLLDLSWRGAAFVAGLILVVRPIAVWCSTIGSGLSLKNRAFLAWFAPRGIVVAAVSSVFALRLKEHGDVLISGAFLTVLGTVVVYGLTSKPLAKRLGIATHDPQGLLIAGANELGRAIASALQEKGFHVVLVDTAFDQIRRARAEGLTTVYANILSERLLDTLDFSKLGRFLALTSNDEVNLLSIARFRKLFGRQNVFQLAPMQARPGRDGKALEHFSGRHLFGPDHTYDTLVGDLQRGAAIKITGLTKEFGIEQFDAHYEGKARPLFVIEDARLHIFSTDFNLTLVPGHAIVSLIPPDMLKTDHAPPEREAPRHDPEPDQDPVQASA
jgi:NhaP-type Na+/H+ or K+/H+ antiporter